jgi:hypothetical protein
MSKHTPGPWSYWSGYNPFDKIESQVTAEGGDIVIASYNSLIDQGEANACLMAAAPDLLEALEGVERLCSQSGYVGVNGQYLKVVRAAIAKARGKP